MFPLDFISKWQITMQESVLVKSKSVLPVITICLDVVELGNGSKWLRVKIGLEWVSFLQMKKVFFHWAQLSRAKVGSGSACLKSSWAELVYLNELKMWARVASQLIYSIKNKNFIFLHIYWYIQKHIIYFAFFLFEVMKTLINTILIFQDLWFYDHYFMF